LRVFDHLAGHTEGSTRVEAAWRCGRSLALLGRYDEALGAFKFAAQALRFEHSAELPAHLKPLADAIARDRSFAGVRPGRGGDVGPDVGGR